MRNQGVLIGCHVELVVTIFSPGTLSHIRISDIDIKFSSSIGFNQGYPLVLAEYLNVY
jgi:hypothetical protein